MKRRNFLKSMLAAIPALWLAKVVEGEEPKDPREEYPLSRVSPDGSLDLIEKRFKYQRFPMGAILFVSLHTHQDYSNDSHACEVVGGGYSRQKIVFAEHMEIDFPMATKQWGKLTHYGLWDSPGSLERYACRGIYELPEIRSIQTGDWVKLELSFI